MKKSVKEEYDSNDFTKALISELDFLMDSDSREGFSVLDNNYHLLSAKEKYVLAVHTEQGKIFTCIEQIEYVSVFVRRFPLKNYFRKNGINQLNYIQYHLETFSHKVATLLDLMKSMVIVVYQAALPEQNLSWDSLKRKVDEKEMPMQVMNTYFEFFNNMIKFRHNVTHKGVFRDTKMKEINVDYGFSLYEQLRDLGVKPDTELLKIRPLWQIDHKIKNYRQDRLNHINNQLQNIYIITKIFLESLIPQFQKQNKEFN